MPTETNNQSGAEALQASEIVGLAGFEDEDPSDVRWAFAIAIVLHVALFSLHLPALAVRAAPPERERDYVVIADRFKSPPPEQQELIPEQRAMRVPIPDPTPEAPEMVRLPAAMEAPIGLTSGDAVFGIPDAPPAPEPDVPLRVGGEVLAPVKVYTPPPRYPELARRARIEGTVIIEAIIDQTGTVTSTHILRSAPMGLDAAAADAVSQWRFEPATLRGRPVAVRFYLTVKFELS